MQGTGSQDPYRLMNTAIHRCATGCHTMGLRLPVYPARGVSRWTLVSCHKAAPCMVSFESHLLEGLHRYLLHLLCLARVAYKFNVLTYAH